MSNAGPEPIRRVDYSLDRIGERIDHPEREPMLAADDWQRIAWIESHWQDARRLLDIGASDGSLTQKFLRQSDTHEAIVVEPHRGHLRNLVNRLSPVRERVGFHFCEFVAAADRVDVRWPDVVLCGEVLEHVRGDLATFLATVFDFRGKVIITVPNRLAQSFEADKRSRWAWPDHVRTFTPTTLTEHLSAYRENIEIHPIVGTLEDSIWIGAVCEAAGE